MDSTFFDAHSLLFFFLFCLWYLIVHSNIMLEQVLGKVDGAVEGNYTTTKGTLIQMLTMIFGYMALLMFVSIVV